LQSRKIVASVVVLLTRQRGEVTRKLYFHPHLFFPRKLSCWDILDSKYIGVPAACKVIRLTETGTEARIFQEIRILKMISGHVIPHSLSLTAFNHYDFS
jgi:hypothetical protein